MKTLKSTVVLLFILLTSQAAFAFYHPSSGRWINRDPIGEPGLELIRGKKASAFTSEPNRYHYVGNNPINQIDLIGLKSWPAPKGYKSCCCDAATTQNGLDILNKRFAMAVAYLQGQGTKPDPDQSKPNTLSCYESSEAIKKYISPTPPCWVCFIEERGPWLPGLYFHNALVCFSPGGKHSPVYFDWFGGETQAENYLWFKLKYPTTSETYPGTRSEAVFDNCDQTSHWSPDNSIIQRYIR